MDVAVPPVVPPEAEVETPSCCCAGTEATDPNTIVQLDRILTVALISLLVDREAVPQLCCHLWLSCGSSFVVVVGGGGRRTDRLLSCVTFKLTRGIDLAGKLNFRNRTHPNHKPQTKDKDKDDDDELNA